MMNKESLLKNRFFLVSSDTSGQMDTTLESIRDSFKEKRVHSLICQQISDIQTSPSEITSLLHSEEKIFISSMPEVRLMMPPGFGSPKRVSCVQVILLSHLIH
jgi:hypothetical protein